MIRRGHPSNHVDLGANSQVRLGFSLLALSSGGLLGSLLSSFLGGWLLSGLLDGLLGDLLWGGFLSNYNKLVNRSSHLHHCLGPLLLILNDYRLWQRITFKSDWNFRA